MVELDVKITSGDLYDFLLRHSYNSVSGLLGAVIGALGVIVGISRQYWIYLILGVVILLYLPWTLYIKSKQQAVNNPVFKEPLHYVLDENGITISQGDSSTCQKWEDCLKAVSTGRSIIVYTAKNNATIFPKSCEKTPEQWIKALAKLPATTFFVLGGEPFLYDGLSELINNLPKQHSILGLVTNASMPIELYKKLNKDKDIKGSKSVTEGEGENAVTYTYIYIFLGTPTNSTASTDAQIFDEQAKQYEISCLYWIDTNLSDSKIEKLNTALNGRAAEIKAETTALLSIRTTVGKSDAMLSFDSTSVVCNKKGGTASGTELTPYQIAQNCFKNTTTIISK